MGRGRGRGAVKLIGMENGNIGGKLQGREEAGEGNYVTEVW